MLTCDVPAGCDPAHRTDVHMGTEALNRFCLDHIFVIRMTRNNAVHLICQKLIKFVQVACFSHFKIFNFLKKRT